MKFLIMLVLVLGSFRAFAEEEQYLLTSQEFKELSKDQQAKYMKSLQKILAEMTKRTLYMAGEESSSANSRMPANVAGMGATAKKDQRDIDELIAEETKVVGGTAKTRADASNFSDPGATGFKVGGKSAPKPASDSPAVPVAENPTPAAKETSPAAANETPAPVASKESPAPEVKETPAPVAKATPAPVAKEKPAAKAAPAKVTAAPAAKTAKVTPESEIINETADGKEIAPAKKAETTSTSSTPSTSKVDAASVKDAKAAVAKKETTPADAKATPKAAAKTDDKAEGKTTGNNYRCMYSGWVVAKDPCQAQDKFPDYYSIEGVDKSKMVCPGKTMCNPTVFGLNVPKNCKTLSEGDCSMKATPLCVKKGAWPTEDCYHLSTFKNAQIAAEINSTIDPVQFDHFRDSFTDLCDPNKIKSNPFSETANGHARTPEKKEAIQKDIRITCSWARKQLQLLKDATNIDKMADGKAKDDARKKWDGSKQSAPKKQHKSEESGSQH